MGMAFVTHAAWLLVAAPPTWLLQRARTIGVAGLLAMASLFAFVIWQLIGAGAAFLFGILHERYPTTLPGVPSAVYLLMILFLSAIATMPALVLMPDRIRHVLFQYLVFAGLFGLFIPFLVSSR